MEMNKWPDQTLVEEFVKGNATCFDILIRRYKDRIFSYIYYTLSDKSLAEDIFQDTCIKAIHSLLDVRYRDSGRFLSWITRIAHNLIIDHYRRSRQLDTTSADGQTTLLNSVRYAEPTIEDQMVSSQIRKDVRKLIDRLPDEQREIILLRHYGDLTFKEIAELTHVSVNTALGRMRYALINLRKLVREHHVILSV